MMIQTLLQLDMVHLYLIFQELLLMMALDSLMSDVSIDPILCFNLDSQKSWIDSNSDY